MRQAQKRRPWLTARGGVLNPISCSDLAVAVGFEPTNGLPRYTLSSSANQSSATVVGVRHVLNRPVHGRP
jgi:tRNA G26 N,N-dimethylase Trm1